MQRFMPFFLALLTATPAFADVSVHHIELAVSQADTAKAWYTQHLPCQTVADRNERIVCGGMQIEFVTRQSLGSSQGTAVDHIGFAYPDVAAKMQALEDVGVGGAGVRLQRFDDGSLVRDDPGTGVHGFIFDPWGTRIELIRKPQPRGMWVCLGPELRTRALRWEALPSLSVRLRRASPPVPGSGP